MYIAFAIVFLKFADPPKSFENCAASAGHLYTECPRPPSNTALAIVTYPADTTPETYFIGEYKTEAECLAALKSDAKPTVDSRLVIYYVSKGCMEKSRPTWMGK